MKQTLENIFTFNVIAEHFKKDMTTEEELSFAEKYNQARKLDIEACNIQVKLMLELVDKTLKKDIPDNLRKILFERKESLESGKSRDVIFQITPYLNDLCKGI